MVRFVAWVEVWLKEGLVDAEGQAVMEALRDLGYQVTSTRVGKVYRILLEAEDEGDAKRMVEEMCRRLLANPVKDNYVFRVERA
ncbi:MAG: phosphoribosylformylglycinamidine synthase subunit PurS [archaeon GB-1867-005]|nr:phosphoribosylformylglycinamidine synthase subunit PurS [Candidatus Culexmicrobium cathedralense]